MELLVHGRRKEFTPMDPAVIAVRDQLPRSKVAALQKRYRERFGQDSKSCGRPTDHTFCRYVIQRQTCLA
jgi:hypothetical protein